MSIRRIIAGTATVWLTLAVSAGAAPAHAASVPAFDHVFLIVMENHAYGQIIGSSSAPYINSLLPTAGVGSNYFAVSHPSLPNYLALVGGSTFGIASDCTTCWVSAPNLGDRLEAAGKSWKAYEESMPSPCFVGDSYPYAQKHDPFIYFNDVRTNTARCQSDVVPYSQLAGDLTNTSTTPNFAFITPNMCDDMHDCSVATGDSWLSSHVPGILASPAFTTQKSLLAIVWDEDDSSSSNQVPAVLIGSGVTTNLQSTVSYNHYSLLHTIESSLGASSVTSNDAAAATMDDFFAFGGPGITQLGGIATSSPAGTATSTTDIYVRGTDYGAWRRSWNGASWGNWTRLGGYLTSQPAAVAQGSQSQVFVSGSDNQLWGISANAGAYGNWQPLGGILTSGPGADSWSGPTMHVDVFVRGTDSGLWRRSLDNGTWSNWQQLGGILTSDPASVAWSPNHIDTFVRGTDNQLWHRGFDNGTWAAWEPLGGILSSGPAAASCASGHLDVFVTGTDGQIWRRGYNGTSWTSWQPLGGLSSADPAAVCPAGSTTVNVFERAPNLALVEMTVQAS